jgi:myosin heavy subunit
MVLEQLQYTGMLDVIHIRAKGFPFKVRLASRDYF